MRKPYACSICGKHRITGHTLDDWRVCQQVARDKANKAQRFDAPQAGVRVDTGGGPLIMPMSEVRSLQGKQLGGLRNKGHKFTSETARAAVLKRHRDRNGRVIFRHRQQEPAQSRQLWRDLCKRAPYRVETLPVPAALTYQNDGTYPAGVGWVLHLAWSYGPEDRPVHEVTALRYLGRIRRHYRTSRGIPSIVTPFPSKRLRQQLKDKP